MYKHFLSGAVRESGGLASQAGFWSEKWSNFQLPQHFHTLERSREWREIRQRVPPGSRILEAGCGLGQWVLFLNQQGYHTSGLDISGETIERLRRAFPACDWRQGDVRALPFSEGCFDAVLSWGVIEHFEEGPQTALEEFRRVLRPGGLLFVTVPFMCWRRKLELRGKTDNRDAFTAGKPCTFYQHVLDLDELRNWISQAQFQVELLTPSALHDGARRLLGIRPGESGHPAARVFARFLALTLPAQALGVMALCAGRKV